MVSETGYAIVSVSEPQEAVELVGENFPVHEKSKLALMMGTHPP